MSFVCFWSCVCLCADYSNISRWSWAGPKGASPILWLSLWHRFSGKEAETVIIIIIISALLLFCSSEVLRSSSLYLWLIMFLWVSRPHATGSSGSQWCSAPYFPFLDPQIAKSIPAPSRSSKRSACGCSRWFVSKPQVYYVPKLILLILRSFREERPPIRDRCLSFEERRSISSIIMKRPEGFISPRLLLLLRWSRFIPFILFPETAS